jgi:hypothetical protein
MRVLDRHLPVPLVLSWALALYLVVMLVLAGPYGPYDDADASPVDLPVEPVVPADDVRLPPPPPPPPAPSGSSWSGFAFDACRAPSQQVMDRWLTSSPFTGVGIYLGGIHRACPQRHLTPAWVTNQVRAGWRLLPIWVGPQASCTGYRHRITARPGASGLYDAARARAAQEAEQAVSRARALGLTPGELLFYDLEPFDTARRHCRGSSLAFLDQWTREVHRLGYRSGVYSHVRAGIALLSATDRDYARPDAVWYAWIDRPGTLPREHVAAPDYMRTSRVHQYALDTPVEFGGHRIAIDWNFVSLGATSTPRAPVGCDDAAGRTRVRPVRSGDRGALVRLVQCLLLPGQPHPVKTSGTHDATTVRAIGAFQAQRGLPATGAVDHRTWTALLSRGSAPVLRRGDRGDDVRRLQRSLNAAAGRPVVRVDGTYGADTARTVRRYRTTLGLDRRVVVTRAVWTALSRGTPLPVRTPARPS